MAGLDFRVVLRTFSSLRSPVLTRSSIFDGLCGLLVDSGDSFLVWSLPHALACWPNRSFGMTGFIVVVVVDVVVVVVFRCGL